MELERLSSDAQLPLTPALSRGEREVAYAALRALWRSGASGGMGKEDRARARGRGRGRARARARGPAFALRLRRGKRERARENLVDGAERLLQDADGCMDADEKVLCEYLKSFRDQFVAAKEISRRA